VLRTEIFKFIKPDSKFLLKKFIQKASTSDVKTFIGGGEATTNFFNNQKNFKWKHQHQ